MSVYPAVLPQKKKKTKQASLKQLLGFFLLVLGRGYLRTLRGSCDGGPVASRRAVIHGVPNSLPSLGPPGMTIPTTTPMILAPAALGESKSISSLRPKRCIKKRKRRAPQETDEENVAVKKDERKREKMKIRKKR